MKVKGEVVKTNEKNITLKDGSEKLKYFVTVKKHDNSLMTLSGWGKCPYEAGQVVEKNSAKNKTESNHSLVKKL